jgi:NAD-dependent dihydropyrimidine dehydrogenase PreA subunit
MENNNLKNRLAVVRIVYFSGTGCTAYVAETFRKELEASGSIVQMHELRHGKPAPEGDYTFLILCFVVHACTAPYPVMQWAESHNTVNQIPAAVISVSGGGEITPNLACRVAIKRRLKKRGFCVEYEKMIVMPSNWIVPTKPCLAARLLEVLPQKVAFITGELASGTDRKTWSGPGNRFLSLLGKLETAGAKEFHKTTIVSDTCNGCGLCSNRCPVGNITMNERKPVFASHCILCLNCFYLCPQKSLYPGTAKFIVIKEGFDLKKIQATIPWSKPLDIKKEASGLLWLGVRRYLLNKSDIYS